MSCLVHKHLASIKAAYFGFSPMKTADLECVRGYETSFSIWSIVWQSLSYTVPYIHDILGFRPDAQSTHLCLIQHGLYPYALFRYNDLGQSSLRRRESDRSARTRPPVWQRG